MNVLELNLSDFYIEGLKRFLRVEKVLRLVKVGLIDLQESLNLIRNFLRMMIIKFLKVDFYIKLNFII